MKSVQLIFSWLLSFITLTCQRLNCLLSLRHLLSSKSSRRKKRMCNYFDWFVLKDFFWLLHLLFSFETCTSSEFMTFIAIHASLSIYRHNAFFNVMLICTFKAAFFILAESDHVIKFKALEALCDTTVFFK